MLRAIATIFLILFCSLAAFAADNPIAGTWNCVSKSETGVEVSWTLVVTSEAGKLAGTLTLVQSGDKIDILEPVLTGNTFTFKIQINPQEIVVLTGNIEGSKLEGTFRGKDSGTGSFKGTRQD